jgi:hypothetical protein
MPAESVRALAEACPGASGLLVAPAGDNAFWAALGEPAARAARAPPARGSTGALTVLEARASPAADAPHVRFRFADVRCWDDARAGRFVSFYACGDGGPPLALLELAKGGTSKSNLLISFPCASAPHDALLLGVPEDLKVHVALD